MEDLTGPTPVGESSKHGIANPDIQKLMEAGLLTVEAVAYSPRKSSESKES